MAERIRKLTNSEVEVLARIIADTMTGSQMNEIFQECGVQDVSNESTKWKRIYYTFLARQEQDGASNSFLNFIKKSLKPVRFISGQNGNYDEILLEINKPLMLIGLQMTNEGKLLKVQAATTISEVERRTRNLVSELQKRHIHQDVIKCCKEEYLQENYFHAVFEAAKSLSEKVREKTGMQEDGSNLFNNAFAVNNPRLAINSLQTPSEKNAQNGLKEMLNGVTHMVRNVTAHPYIRVADMRPGYVDVEGLMYVPDEAYFWIQKYRIYRDDIYISVAGTLGIVGQIPGYLDGANLTENANRITDIKCNIKFLMYWLMSSKIQGLINQTQTLGAQPKLALTRIRKPLIPWIQINGRL